MRAPSGWRMPKRKPPPILPELPRANSAATPPGRWEVVRGPPSEPRRRKGPVPGTVDRYSGSDRKLYPKIKRLIKKKHMSATAAARHLVDQGMVTGIGSPESRVRRLANRYLAYTR
jgi:hypothetical protein